MVRKDRFMCGVMTHVESFFRFLTEKIVKICVGHIDRAVGE